MFIDCIGIVRKMQFNYMQMCCVAIAEFRIGIKNKPSGREPVCTLRHVKFACEVTEDATGGGKLSKEGSLMMSH